jgi:hypothetical protein
MKKVILLILFFGLWVSWSYSQDSKNIRKGNISYVTSQNIYVKFASTDGIAEGDTLFFEKAGKVEPAMIVSNTSSISAICKPLGLLKFEKGQELFFSPKKEERPEVTEIVAAEQLAEVAATTTPAPSSTQKTVKTEKPVNEPDVNGKISLSSYSNLSSKTPLNQRMRYTFALNADHISHSNFSIESYLSFAHSNQNWDAVKDNIFNGLKIYNLAMKYQNQKGLNIYFGRKINPNLSNIGAIDGLQIEKNMGSFVVGGFTGSRPDYRDYSYNFNLFQFGVFAGHKFVNKNKGEMRNHIAIVEQQNNWNTDRRFAYFQHSQNLLKNLSLFGTAELELYRKVNGIIENNVRLTNLYLILRYRILRNLSFSLSYSNRNNLIYYETYKDMVDRLIEQTSLQGFGLSINYRPINKLSIGLRGTYRSRESDIRATKNINAYISYLSIPGINTTATLSGTYLETSYLNGYIYSLNLSKDIVKRKLYGGLNYRYVAYDYTFTDLITKQHIAALNLNWRIYQNLRASIALEGIFENDYQYQRIYFNITKRF